MIQADGGTRTTSITGSFVALAIAVSKIAEQHRLPAFPITDFLASVSVGIVNGEPMLDLNYEEDSTAKVDMNIVMTGGGAFVELQGPARKARSPARSLTSCWSLGNGGYCS